MSLSILKIQLCKHQKKTCLLIPETESATLRCMKLAKAIGSNLAETLAGKKNQPVGVLIDRDIASLILFLGVIYSGNFYVPMDKNLPTNRINQIIETLNLQVILATAESSRILPEISFVGRCLLYEDLVQSPINQPRLDRIRSEAIDTDPLYSIFTSGSTGTPKGVLICHRSVIDLVEQFNSTFPFGEHCIFGNQAPFDFDVSVKDIYLTLSNNASLVIIPKSFFSFPIKLIECLNAEKINVVIWATSALRIIANLKSFSAQIPTFLQVVMFSGEVMPNKVLNYWRTHLPNPMYVNLYGPTEITCNCTYHIVKKEYADTDPLPIGIAFRNTEILVLNHKNELVQPGEKGEICVRGTSLAHGYYNNPVETKKRFCQNPLNKEYPELIYRTGDIGMYNSESELMFLTRKDNQIKHMGHRIELGEIEVFVNSIPIIDTGFCIYDQVREKIILFYQSPTWCDKELIVELQKSLPKYMLPNILVHSEQLPLNKNAKIDRIAVTKQYYEKKV